MPIYPSQEIMLLNFDTYFEKLERRGRKIFRLRRTQTFEAARNIEIAVSTEHVWSYGDSLLKLSYKYYGDSKFWWVIGFINKKPTDSHFRLGDEIMIPDHPQIIIGALRE